MFFLGVRGDDKNSRNSAKTSLFFAYEFFISETIK
jgi:hypothetical protein